MSNQLIKKNHVEGYKNIFPKTFTDAIRDKESGVSLQEILRGFNMYFLSYNGNKSLTRCKVPSSLRKEGLWITYVLYDHTVVTEWYNSDQIDDNSWSMDSNWRVASNTLVGDVSVSIDGYWVVNGEKTEAKAQGEQGVTPLLRVGANNKLQVSYNAGKAWRDISDYIVPQFRWNQGTGTTTGVIQISMDLGSTWRDLSNPITNHLRISRYIGINDTLPTSEVEEGAIYMKGPYYDETDTLNENPIYRMWIYAWNGNTLAWQDNGEFISISAGVVQETGYSETEVMSQAAVTRELTELGSYVSNSEYARAYTDAEGRFLWGIKHDGSIEFAKGVPTPVKEYVEPRIDELNSIVNRKVDIIDGKSLIDSEYADGVSHVATPEWIDVKVDNNGKILEGIKKDGTKKIPGNVEVDGNFNIAGMEYKMVSSHEYLAAWVDAKNKVLFGIKIDGKTYVANADFLDTITANKEAIDKINKALADTICSTDVDMEAVKSIKVINNPEYIDIETDSEDKVLGGRRSDGTKFENMPMEFGGHTLQNIRDKEGRCEMTLDSENRVVSYRKKDGTKVENVGIETPNISVKTLNIPTSEAQKLAKNGVLYDKKIMTEDPLNLPAYGSLNFVTDDIPFQYQDDVVISAYIESVSGPNCTNVGYIQFGEGNSSISWFDDYKYYIKREQVGTTIRIYAPKLIYSPAKALAVRFVLYVDGLNVTEDSSITYTNILLKRDEVTLWERDTYTLNIGRIDGQYNDSYTGIYYLKNGMFGYIESLDKFLVWNWAVNKNTEHYGQIQINLPGYLDATEYASIKFQGNSTLFDLKKSFRLTLYNGGDYGKKKKVKIGDMIRLSGFNLKSFSNRPVRFNESLAYRMVHMMWRSRTFLDQYPWNKTHVIYTGATGSIKQFPIKMEINGDFYGLNFMGEKKDEGNYMLDGKDQSGMFLSLGSNNIHTFSNLNTFLSGWEDEMIDENDTDTPWVNTTDRKTTSSNIAALTDWFNYFNSKHFNEETAEIHFSKMDWIDYMIFVQVFCLQDNLANNLLIYTDSNKTKFYPYVYDLDQALDSLSTTGDIFAASSYDTSLYQKLTELWWEDIVARYRELREGCLSVPVFTKIANKLCSSVSYSDFEDEMKNWNLSDSKKIDNIIKNFVTRLSFCDNFYK